MADLGDIALGTTLDFNFTTVAAATGAPTTLAGSPSLSAYVGTNVTQITAGLTLTVDFDGKTGFNHVTVVATGGNGFAAGTDVTVVIEAGTVGGTSVVGYVVGSFSIEHRSSVRPTVAGRTLDVAATGEAGLDFDNIKQATGATTLTNIRVPNVTLADTTTALTTNNDKTGYALGAGGFGATAGAANSLTAAMIATAFANALSLNNLQLADGVETGFSQQAALRLILSSVVAILAGAGTGTCTIKDINNTKIRITATTDASGNRTAVVVDAT